MEKLNKPPSQISPPPPPLKEFEINKHSGGGLIEDLRYLKNLEFNNRQERQIYSQL